MVQKKINIRKKFDRFSDYWSPKVIAEMNDYQFKLARVKENLFGTIIKKQMKFLSLLKGK